MADVFSLDKLSIKKLKALAGRNNVSLRGCFEKSDIIKTLRDAGVKEVRLKAGESAFELGEEGASFFCVVTGTLSLRQITNDLELSLIHI